MTHRNAIFCRDTNRIIDTVPAGSDGTAWFAKHGTTYGRNLVVIPFDEAHKRYEESFKTEPVEITEAKWHEMLCVLPPVAWKRDPSGESFKMSERMAGSITGIYVRLGDRYFQFYDDIRLSHPECVARCVLSRANLKDTEPA